MLIICVATESKYNGILNSLRAGTVWVNCYDVLEAQVLTNDENDDYVFIGKS